MWNNKFMAWIEQKLIDLTSTVYLKRREVTPVVELTPPTMEPVKRVEPTKPLVKAKAKPKAKPAAKPKAKPAAKPKAKPAAKKPAAKAKPAAKTKPAAMKAKTKAKAK